MIPNLGSCEGQRWLLYRSNRCLEETPFVVRCPGGGEERRMAQLTDDRGFCCGSESHVPIDRSIRSSTLYTVYDSGGVERRPSSLDEALVHTSSRLLRLRRRLLL